MTGVAGDLRAASLESLLESLRSMGRYGGDFDLSYAEFVLDEIGRRFAVVRNAASLAGLSSFLKDTEIVALLDSATDGVVADEKEQGFKMLTTEQVISEIEAIDRRISDLALRVHAQDTRRMGIYPQLLKARAELAFAIEFGMRRTPTSDVGGDRKGPDNG